MHEPSCEQDAACLRSAEVQRIRRPLDATACMQKTKATENVHVVLMCMCVRCLPLNLSYIDVLRCLYRCVTHHMPRSFTSMELYTLEATKPQSFTDLEFHIPGVLQTSSFTCLEFHRL